MVGTLPRTLAALAALALPASGTWSIVLVHQETREVIVASATCLADFDLQVALPVIRVGEGGAAAQSQVDQSGANRLLIWQGLGSDTPPKQILQALAAGDALHQTRQYGIVDTDFAPAAFTGAQAGPAKKKVEGVDGPWRYAIQGNVLTAQAVIDAAEQALLQTPGDGSQRVMAAMEAARALGGDGRCSCALFAPTSCGAPPPGFQKSAHTAFLVVARLGDTDGGCEPTQGCASGDYHLELNVIGGPGDLDPVTVLQGLYDAWRASQVGLPDGLTSTVQAGASQLVADGLSQTTVLVRLFDLDGAPLTMGGATVVPVPVGATTPVSQPSAVVDHGDGSYSFELTASTQPGLDSWAIEVTDAGGTVVLAPYLELAVDPLVPLHAGLGQLSVTAGGAVPLQLNSTPGSPYLILASLSGVSPGIPLGGAVLPLQFDALFALSLAHPNGQLFQGTAGLLDAAGRGSAQVVLPPGLATALAGLRVDLAAVVGTPLQLTATNAVGFDLWP
jgi:uncharacterized Ntn-hydrolase superfamily protein